MKGHCGHNHAGTGPAAVPVHVAKVASLACLVVVLAILAECPALPVMVARVWHSTTLPRMLPGNGAPGRA
jgi:hypothetical protein